MTNNIVIWLIFAFIVMVVSLFSPSEENFAWWGPGWHRPYWRWSGNYQHPYSRWGWGHGWGRNWWGPVCPYGNYPRRNYFYN